MAINLVGSGVLDAAGAAAFTALIVQQTKFLLEYVVHPDDKNHDNIIRLYVDVVAIAVVIGAQLVSSTLHVHNGADWFNGVVQGFGVALAAISGYHLLNGMSPQTVPAAKAQQTTDTGTPGNGVHAPLLAELQTMATPSTSTAAVGSLPISNNSAVQAGEGDLPVVRTASAGDTNFVRVAARGDGTLASWILQSRVSLAD